MPPTIGAVISCGQATLRECQEYYSLEDVYLMLEIASVNARNQAEADKPRD